MEERSPAHQALMSYRQADEEGIMVTVSRQAIHEVSDEIERLRAALREIVNDNPCTCDAAYFERSLVAPDCLASLAGDRAREALGMPIECKGRLAPPSDAQKKAVADLKDVLGRK